MGHDVVPTVPVLERSLVGVVVRGGSLVEFWSLTLEKVTTVPGRTEEFNAVVQVIIAFRRNFCL